MADTVYLLAFSQSIIDRFPKCEIEPVKLNPKGADHQILHSFLCKIR